MTNDPLVSICCITYNHEKYIQQCLEGFLIQKTTFLFEILIHDDASTDRTADIIREYETKYPDIIKPIYQTENQYSKGVIVSAVYNWPRAKGKYIALCEGDDYWIDSYKLQKQVDFMEANPEYGLVYTDYYSLLGNNFRKNSEIGSRKEHFEINAAPHIISDNIQRIGTATALLRKDLLMEICEKHGDDFYSGPGDNVVWFHSARLSKIKYLDVVTSVYRKAKGGATGTGDFTKRYCFLKKVYSQKKHLAEKYGYPEIIEKIDKIYTPNLYIMSRVLGNKEDTDKFYDVLIKIYPKLKLLQLYYRYLKLKIKYWLKGILVHIR
jgi:glycosyltransferase involved in cell wall biosynthesis